MVTKCCVPLCKHHDKIIKKSNVVSFHTFPKEEKIREQWAQNIKQPDFQVNYQSKVCSAHFRPEDYIFCQSAGMITLKPDAVPTVFAWTTEKTSEESKNRFIVFDDVKDGDSVSTERQDDSCNEDMIMEPQETGDTDEAQHMFIMSCESEGEIYVDELSETENLRNEEKRLKNMSKRLAAALTGESEIGKTPTSFLDTPELSDSVLSKNSNNLIEQEDLPFKDKFNSYGFSESTKSSALSSFPLSLVMNHPNFQLRLPLLSSSVDPFCSDIVHTVIDEVGILANQSFALEHPVTGKNVTVSPAGKNIVKELKSKLAKSGKGPNKWSNSSNASNEKENVFRGVSDSIKRDLVLQSCEDSDYLMQNKKKFNNVDFYTLPSGKILLGRTSKGEWLIGCQRSQGMNKSKISSCDYRISDTGFLNDKNYSNKSIPNEHTLSVHTAGNANDITREDVDDGHRTEAYTGISCTAWNANDITREDVDDGHRTEADTGISCTAWNANDITREDVDDGHRTEADTGTFLKELTTSESSNDITSENCQKTVLPRQPLKQESVTLATDEPRPVMLLRSDRNSLQGIQVSGNQSEIHVGNSFNFPSEDHNFPSGCEVKVKEELVDTGCESELKESTTEQADSSSLPVVKFPILTQFGKKNNDSSRKNNSKLGQKRKVDDTVSTSSSKFILINPVCTDQHTSQSDGQEMDEKEVVEPTKSYKCDKCHYTSKRQFNVNRHNLTKHSIIPPSSVKNYICDHCGRQYGSKYGLSLHIRMKHTESFRFQCKICGQGFVQKGNYRGHLASHNHKLKEKCETCGKTFQYRNNLMTHKKKCNEPSASNLNKNYVCDKCSETFSSHKTLKDHYRGKHGSKSYFCDICGKSFKWRSSLHYHRKNFAH